MAEQSLPPSWIRWVATNNPVTRAAQAGRSAAFSDADRGLSPPPPACSCSRCSPVRPSPPGPSTATSPRF